MPHAPSPHERKFPSLRKLALALLLVLIGAPLLRNAERAPLDGMARRKAPGQFVALTHGAVHYRIAGPAGGAPVLLVPGVAVPDYVFDGTRASLAAAGFRVVSYDLYGRGWSDRPDLRYDRALLAGQLDELMTALGMPAAHLVGLSMGGAVAAHFAARAPQRVRSLTLIAPLTQARAPGVLDWKGVGDWVFRALTLPALPDQQLAELNYPERTPDWQARFRPQMEYRGFGRAQLSSLRHLASVSSLPDFARVGAAHVPVQLIWGQDDRIEPYVTHTQVEAAIPQARFVSLAHTGHLPVLENGQATHAALIAFLRQH